MVWGSCSISHLPSPQLLSREALQEKCKHPIGGKPCPHPPRGAGLSFSGTHSPPALALLLSQHATCGVRPDPAWALVSSVAVSCCRPATLSLELAQGQGERRPFRPKGALSPGVCCHPPRSLPVPISSFQTSPVHSAVAPPVLPPALGGRSALTEKGPCLGAQIRRVRPGPVGSGQKEGGDL